MLHSTTVLEVKSEASLGELFPANNFVRQPIEDSVTEPQSEISEDGDLVMEAQALNADVEMI